MSLEIQFRFISSYHQRLASKLLTITFEAYMHSHRVSANLNKIHFISNELPFITGNYLYFKMISILKKILKCSIKYHRFTFATMTPECTQFEISIDVLYLNLPNTHRHNTKLRLVGKNKREKNNTN